MSRLKLASAATAVAVADSIVETLDDESAKRRQRSYYTGDSLIESPRQVGSNYFGNQADLAPDGSDCLDEHVLSGRTVLPRQCDRILHALIHPGQVFHRFVAKFSGHVSSVSSVSGVSEGMAPGATCPRCHANHSSSSGSPG